MMTTKQLLDLWGEGKNSFKADPPNAMLSGNGQDVSIVILESITIDQGMLVYSLVHSLPQSANVERARMLSDMVLVIDYYDCKACSSNTELQQPTVTELRGIGREGYHVRQAGTMREASRGSPRPLKILATQKSPVRSSKYLLGKHDLVHPFLGFYPQWKSQGLSLIDDLISKRHNLSMG